VTDFGKRIANSILAIFLALSWMWAGLLKDMKIIDDNHRLWVLIGFTAVLVVQQAYLALPKPINRGIVEAQRPVIEPYVNGFLTRYYEQLSALGAQPVDSRPCVRVNVMFPTKRWRGIRDNYLKIYHVACPPKVNYSDDELAEKWKKREGTCGWAWQAGDRSIFDSKDEKLSLPADRLSESQRRVTAHLKSTLSVPIWDIDKNTVVGVLNLDSEQNIEASLFNDGDIIRLAAGCAQHLVAFCFPSGVAA